MSLISVGRHDSDLSIVVKIRDCIGIGYLFVRFDENLSPMMCAPFMKLPRKSLSLKSYERSLRRALASHLPQLFSILTTPASPFTPTAAFFFFSLSGS